LAGREFEFVRLRQNWGEERAFFLDDEGALRSLPACWTDRAPLDPFVEIAAGRCAFRARDLLKLAGLLARLRSDRVDDA